MVNAISLGINLTVKIIMKYLFYLGSAVLGALILVLSPHGLPTAHASEQAPRLDSWAPAKLTDQAFNGALISIQGPMWPNQSYGLSAYLFDKQTLTRIPLQTLSYTPLAERMVVEVPSYVARPASARAYDLAITTINGTQTIVQNAILVGVDEPVVVTPPPTGGTEEPTVTPPLVLPTPSTDIVRETINDPFLTGYIQDRIWSIDSGSVIVITGSGWPTTEYGLEALLVNPTTNIRIKLETISYTPEAGRMVTRTNSYISNATAGWYDLVVMTQSGRQTTIRHAVQYFE